MRFTIKSRKLGKEVEFSLPGRYIYVNLNGRPGSLGDQICHGGHLTGTTIMFSGDGETFKKICRTWWAAYLKNERG